MAVKVEEIRTVSRVACGLIGAILGNLSCHFDAIYLLELLHYK